MQDPTMSMEQEGSGGSGVVVVLAGLITTALTLAGVYFISSNYEEVNIMGWYLWFIVPAGAIGVGVLAASGYGILSWLTGVRISASLLVAVLGFQIAAYFAGQYIEFYLLDLIYDDGTTVPFFAYFDIMARSFSWAQDDGSSGTPFGVWGYAFRLLEVAGFAGGGLIAPLILSDVPYCGTCQRYMKGAGHVLLPASIEVRKIKKDDIEGQRIYDEELEQAYQAGLQLAEAIAGMADSGNATGVRDALAPHREHQKKFGKLPIRIRISLSACKQCMAGKMTMSLLAGQGDKTSTEEMSSAPLRPNFVMETNN
jgi:hypothetical protein